MIQSTINLSKIKGNKLYQSSRGVIRHIKEGEMKLTSMGKEKRRSSSLIQPTSKTQTKIRVKGCNQQPKIISCVQNRGLKWTQPRKKDNYI